MRLRHSNPQIEAIVRELLEQVLPVAHPKAVYIASWVDNKDSFSVDIEGARFTSRVLSKNLTMFKRVFPYVATCGCELEEIRISSQDMLKTYCLDVIKMLALGTAIARLSETVTKKYTLGQTSHMNPGSLADWPLPEQQKLFPLFGDVEKLIGVRLSTSSMMYPLKSSSGIFFTSDTRFESCQLCPRENCPGRRATYSTEMLEKYLG